MELLCSGFWERPLKESRYLFFVSPHIFLVYSSILLLGAWSSNPNLIDQEDKGHSLGWQHLGSTLF